MEDTKPRACAVREPTVLHRAPLLRAEPGRDALDFMPSIPAPTQLKATLIRLYQSIGVSRHGVIIEIVDGTILACAKGLSPIGAPLGYIELNRALFELLSPEEVEFVIAHEAAHIHRSHVVATGGFALVRAAYEAIARGDDGNAEFIRAVLVAYDLWKIYEAVKGGLPPDAQVTKDQELEADLLGVQMTRNLGAAVSALTKLVGGRMDAPSHTWEVFKTDFPVMTVGERIQRLIASAAAVLGLRLP